MWDPKIFSFANQLCVWKLITYKEVGELIFCYCEPTNEDMQNLVLWNKDAFEFLV